MTKNCAAKAFGVVFDFGVVFANDFGVRFGDDADAGPATNTTTAAANESITNKDIPAFPAALRP
jgi:hypothetical protein